MATIMLILKSFKRPADGSMQCVRWTIEDMIRNQSLLFTCTDRPDTKDIVSIAGTTVGPHETGRSQKSEQWETLQLLMEKQMYLLTNTKFEKMNQDLTLTSSGMETGTKNSSVEVTTST
jgi:hypothetical protein